MTTLITPRPQGLTDLINAAVHRVCLTILGDAGQVDLMTEDVVDCYDHFFLIDGQGIYDKLVNYGWRLTPEQVSLLGTIYPEVETLEHARLLAWYDENKAHLNPRHSVGDPLAGGVIEEVGLTEEGLVAMYLIRVASPDPLSDKQIKLPFEQAHR